mmetsp:Transcript_38644/g.75004  ORF Transcript_38644/g.75004 Transcript_38644/m.75004 type:complete len:551 (+) Transcript_38644:1-1653(+)
MDAGLGCRDLGSKVWLASKQIAAYVAPATDYRSKHGIRSASSEWLASVPKRRKCHPQKMRFMTEIFPVKGLIRQILHCLSPSDLCKLHATCRKFKHIIDNSEDVFRSLFLAYASSSDQNVHPEKYYRSPKMFRGSTIFLHSGFVGWHLKHPEAVSKGFVTWKQALSCCASWTCSECGDICGCVVPPLMARVCSKCIANNLSEYGMIFSSRAKSHFLVTDKQLKRLPNFDCSFSTRKRRVGAGKLYAAKHVRMASMDRWGSMERLAQEREKRAWAKLYRDSKRYETVRSSCHKMPGNLHAEIPYATLRNIPFGFLVLGDRPRLGDFPIESNVSEPSSLLYVRKCVQCLFSGPVSLMVEHVKFKHPMTQFASAECDPRREKFIPFRGGLSMAKGLSLEKQMEVKKLFHGIKQAEVSNWNNYADFCDTHCHRCQGNGYIVNSVPRGCKHYGSLIAKEQTHTFVIDSQKSDRCIRFIVNRCDPIDGRTLLVIKCREAGVDKYMPVTIVQHGPRSSVLEPSQAQELQQIMSKLDVHNLNPQEFLQFILLCVWEDT